MRLILLSGGSGSRLWPLSNDSRSKQFLRVLNNNDSLESMVQRVWGQIQQLNLDRSTIIATSKSQIDIIKRQLGSDVPLVVEPERRDTFPAIALAATYLYSELLVNKEETVVVIPVDPFVEIGFFERLLDIEESLATCEADIALIGVKPTYPSEKYGYIVPEKMEMNDNIQVSFFKEKPTETEAIELIMKDALWNCGVFAFKLEYLISLLEQKNLPISFQEMLENYYLMEHTSFDYAVVEKAKKVIAIPYYGGWKDLGTWNTLTEEMATNQIGKGIVSDSPNTHLINELDIPVVVLGVKDTIIAVSPDGILVSDKASSPKIKEVLGGFKQRPMYEECQWGWYTVLDYRKYDAGNEVLTKVILIQAGQFLSYHFHKSRTEIWTIVNGEGEYVTGQKVSCVMPGDVLINPAGTMHGVKALTDLEIIEVQMGTIVSEDDIVYINHTWEELLEQCRHPDQEL